jgi:inner membrane protein
MVDYNVGSVSEQTLEPVTHLLTGACLGRAGFNRKTALATLTLTLATEMPDIDMLGYFGGSVTGFAHHRGITHSLIGAPLDAALTIALVYGIYRWMRRRGRAPAAAPNWRLLYLFAVVGALVHLLQDFTNSYGVRPFAPFNPKWYSWDIVFIIDPIMLIALLCGLAIPGLFSLVTEEIGERKSPFRGRGGAVFAISCLALVIFIRDLEHRRAVSALSSVTYRDQDALRVSAFATIWNPFTWDGVVETRDFFQLVPVNSRSGELDTENDENIRYKPEETPATLAAKKSRLGQVYLDWAQYPLAEVVRRPHGEEYLVRFTDLRFSGITRAQKGQPSVLAAYVLLDPTLHVQEMFMGTPPPEMMK